MPPDTRADGELSSGLHFCPGLPAPRAHQETTEFPGTWCTRAAKAVGPQGFIGSEFTIMAETIDPYPLNGTAKTLRPLEMLQMFTVQSPWLPCSSEMHQ